MSQDLRSYLSMVEEKGLLSRVKKEVDPLTQMGTLFSETEKPLIFDNVKGFPGWRVCGELLTNRDCQAAMLGVSKENIIKEIARLIAEGPLKCKKVSTGPVKEKILLGKDADLNKIPFVIHSEKDAGRYLGGGINITKNPDTGILNGAVLRMQIKGPQRTGILIAPRHTWADYMKYEERNEPMPMAVAIGQHPLIDLAACYCGAYELDEFELAGRFLGESVEMVKCETIDLEVPATAEIVIEGTVPPKLREEEGPFGEFQLYYSPEVWMNPVFNVTAITMRKDAIYRQWQATRFGEHQAPGAILKSANLYERIKVVEGGIDIKDIDMPIWGAGFLVLMSIVPRYEGQVKTVILAALSGSFNEPSTVIVVDDDVDIRDPRDVFWALTTRVNPTVDVVTLDNIRCNSLDNIKPMVSRPGEGHQRVGGKWGVDATKPSASRPKERETFQKANPMGMGKISLKDVLDD